jgi:hypothetical protein
MLIKNKAGKAALDMAADLHIVELLHKQLSEVKEEKLNATQEEVKDIAYPPVIHVKINDPYQALHQEMMKQAKQGQPELAKLVENKLKESVRLCHFPRKIKIKTVILTPLIDDKK